MNFVIVYNLVGDVECFNVLNLEVIDLVEVLFDFIKVNNIYILVIYYNLGMYYMVEGEFWVVVVFFELFIKMVLIVYGLKYLKIVYILSSKGRNLSLL